MADWSLIYREIEQRHKKLKSRTFMDETKKEEIHGFINFILDSSSNIPSVRERSFVKCYLTYWASYLVCFGEKYPDIKLDGEDRMPEKLVD